MKIGICAGSYDPITKGHSDIIFRATKVVDKVIVGVLINPQKNSLFSVEERIDMIKHVVNCVPNVEVKSFDGLLVDFATKENASFLIRGLRAVTDFEYELQQAQTNKVLNKNIETLFFTTDLQCSYISSSMVKSVAMFGGDITKFVDPYVEKQLKIKYNLER